MILACDLGGTNFRAALLDTSGRVVWQSLRSSGAEATATEIDPESW